MSKIYTGQNSLRLVLDTSIDITTASIFSIKYIKPDNTTGSFDATITGTTSLYYDFSTTELDQAGLWTFWAYVVFSDGRNAPGNAVEINVYSQGK